MRVSTLTRSGLLLVTNSISHGVITAESSASPSGPWVPEKNVFSRGPSAELEVTLDEEPRFFRAAMVDLAGFSERSTFLPDDITDLPTLALRLSSPAGDDLLSQFLSEQLSPSTIDLLFSYPGGPDPELQQILSDELNLILEGGLIYEPERFANLQLLPSTQTLLGQSPQGAALVRLNRWLLEDAYPRELATTRNIGFTNLVDSYGLLDTIAGSGAIACVSCNSWNPSFEGARATNTALSSPHLAMADRAGNIYIVDKRAHAIRKVTTEGELVTVAGLNVAGYGDTNPAPATSVTLNNPNGLWVRQDGAFYILDRDNGLIRKVDTNGVMTAVVDNGVAIPGGRGLWVSEDETRIVFAAGSQLKVWKRGEGLSVLADGFGQIGNIAADPDGLLAITDSGASRVYRLNADGSRTVIAGNGTASGGGDGSLAVETGLEQVRAICFLPTGAFLLGTDGGCQVWYVDPDGRIHLFLNGDGSFAHTGDGAWFYDEPGGAKVSAVKGITMDYAGNVLITESELGYVRKVSFLRRIP